MPGDGRMAYVKFALFQGVWLACALGAAADSALPGTLAAMVLLALHLATATRMGPAVGAVLAAAILGLILETLFLRLKVLGFSAPWPLDGLAPVWIVALWASFAATSDSAFKVLGRAPYLKAALAGAIAGPLSYLAGEKLGALVIQAPRWQGFCVLAAAWAVAYPLLLAFEALRAGTSSRPEPYPASSD